MSRRFGLLAGMMLVLLLVGQVAAQDVSVFEKKGKDLPHKYGIQLTGGFATYGMSDMNDFIAGSSAAGFSVEDEAQSGIGFGIAILYRSHEHFRWSIGYNHLGQDKAYATWTNGGEKEILVSAGEFTVLGAYLFPITDWFALNLTAGPTIINADISVADTGGPDISDIHGRALGFLGGIGADLNLGDTWAIHFLGGYRAGKISDLLYTDTSDIEQTWYWTSSGGNRTVVADYSGIFVELGLRMYFGPGTNWVEF